LAKSCDIVVEVVEVKGVCDAKLQKGDRFVLSGANIDLRRSDRICYWALSDLMPAVFSMQLGHDPKELGLSNESGAAYMCCSDPGPNRTPGGNVLFRLKKAIVE
jgi:uncharacterized repeat protein (TIGR04076 family)